ncbi:hypothetical protein BGZ80_009555 [Entomortierella chlamydospora]|uniref:Peroxin/Ferlin domain-containing protein n=1 Tax=Entomortierella chlamydospora TaxID=101097 RepID=A0A9P6T0D1_9FUNG|nr:hypothetical protein BGZ79_001619 [Entomortierella chlamydospora]KAG0015900.1 hypothetical protein BGZ80_009555 [Entomortierella chlamydospora]
MSSKAETITLPYATPNATFASKTPDLEVALTNTELSAQTPPPKSRQHSTAQEDNSQGVSTDSSDSQQSDSAQKSNVLQDDVFTPMWQLSGPEALQEEERASEKIQQMLRPLSRLNTVRRNITQTINQEISSSYSQPISRNSYLPEPDINTPGPSHGQRDSVFSTESSVADSIVGSIRSQSKVKISTKARKKPIPLIEIEPPKLVDAQTAPGDRRYFQRPEDYKPEGDFVYEILYQHQRGAFIFGTPKFSSKSLLPIDPDEWTDDRFETSPMDITDFVVPDPTWEWVHKTWLVDMTGDVDEDGWEYAMTFHGSPWHGNYEALQSFARRRRWIRLRKRKGKTLGKPGPLPERTYPPSINSATWTKLDIAQHLDDPSPFPPVDPSEDSSDGNLQPHLLKPPKHPAPIDLFKIVKKARSDREKLAYTAQYVVRYPGHLDDLEKRLTEYLNLFDYETSRREFLSLLAAYSGVKKEAIKESANHLEFFSDRKRLNLK